MNKREIEEGNDLIIDFCEYRKLPHFNIRIFEYHKRWEQLMPIVEKIEALKEFLISVDIYKRSCQIRISDLHGDKIQSIYYRLDTKIDSVFKSVVEFIKWYNDKK